MLFDEGKYRLYNQNITARDPLGFEDSKKYSQRLKDYQKKSQLPEAVLNAEGTMGGIQVLISAMAFAFMGGEHGFGGGREDNPCF